jgi:amidase
VTSSRGSRAGTCAGSKTLIALAGLLVGLLLPATGAQAINSVTSANGTVWQVNDAAAPAADTGSLWAATGTTASALGGIHVRVSGATPPLRNGELVRGFGLRYDGGEDFRTTTAVPLGNIAISRDIHIERAGNWARWVDTFKNMGRQARLVEVAFGGYVSSGITPGNQAQVAATSSGDTTIGSDDGWVTFATPTAAATTPTSGPSNYGPIAAVFGSPAPFAGGLVGTSQIMLDPFSSPLPTSGNGANKVGLRERLVLQPGEAKSLVNFLVIGLSETQNLVGAPSIPAAGSEIAAVTAKAEELAAEPDFSALSTAQICGVSNFDISTLAIPGFSYADCASVSDPSLAPVPAAPAPTTSSPYDVVGKTITQLQADMASGKTTSQEITRAYLDRIAVYDTGPWGLHSYIHVADDAMAQARRADQERAAGSTKPLLGVPISLKDLYDTKDQPTTGGFLGLEGYTPPKDAFQVKRLRDAGAVLIGKVNLNEMAHSGGSDGSGFGTTWNGLQPSRSSMGSSAGSGASVAASLAPVSMGTQTGVSLFAPAIAGSLATIRATTGLTSTQGVIPLILHGDSAGPIARSVADLATILNVTAGTNPEDPETAESDARKPADFTSFLRKDALQGVRLGYDPAAFTNPDGETTSIELAEEQFDDLEAAGAEIVEMPTPLPTGPWFGGINITAWQVEGYNRWLAEHPGTGFANGEELWNSPLHNPLADFGPWSGPPSTLEEEKQFVEARWALGQEIMDWMDANDVDATISPSRTAPLDDAGGNSSSSINGLSLWNMFASSLVNLPSVNVPTGLDASGSPSGIQFSGRAWDDGKLLGYAYALEQQIGDGQVLSKAAPKLAYDPDATPKPIEIEIPEAPITQRPPGEPPAAVPFNFGRPSLRSKQLRLGRKRRIRVAVGCTGPSSCGMRVTLRARKRGLGSKTRTVEAGGKATIVFKLNRKRYAAALAAKRLRVTLAPIGPSTGGRITKTLPLSR